MERGDEDGTPYRAPTPGPMVRGCSYDMEEFLMECVSAWCQKAGLKKSQLKDAAAPFSGESKEQPCWVDEEIGRDRYWAQPKKQTLIGRVRIADSPAAAAVPELPPRLCPKSKVFRR